MAGDRRLGRQNSTASDRRLLGRQNSNASSFQRTLQRTISIGTAKRQYKLRKPICPFISSTFKDFQVERDYLVKKIFPSLDSLCRSRGTSFAPTDLRWGITHQQAKKGNVLKLCLDYVKQSSPFFIGLLGERYGSHRSTEAPLLPSHCDDINIGETEGADWLDKTYQIAAMSDYEWVLQEAYQQCSFTELEIIQSAFLMESEHCYFYFRSPRHVDKLYTDLPENIRKEKLQDYLPESEYAASKVLDLKQRIVNKGLPVNHFSSPEELGRLLFRDWKKVINRMYPPLYQVLGSSSIETFNEWMAHETFAESRRRTFISTPELEELILQLTDFAVSCLDEVDEDDMDAFQQQSRDMNTTTEDFSSGRVSRTSSPAPRWTSILLVKGERGCGKTATVASWAKEFMELNPNITVIAHYVGCSAVSTDITTFLRKATRELRGEYYQQSGQEQDDEHEDLADFKRVCEAFIAAASLAPSVLLLDGVDELGGTYGLTPQQVKELTWLPSRLPSCCKLILTSSTSDLSYKGISRRMDTEVMTIPPLSDDSDKKAIIQEHLAVHHKALTDSQLSQIAAHKLSDRPLFLSVLANELRVFGVYGRLEEHLSTYLAVGSIRELWGCIIQRWVTDYGWTVDYTEFKSESPIIEIEGWVADALRLLAVSREGLTQADILALLCQMGYTKEAEVTAFDWALFRQAALDMLFERPGGLVVFFHHHFKEAVEHVLLRPEQRANGMSSRRASTSPGEEKKGIYHQHLVSYFARQPHSSRRTDELPWHLQRSGDLDGLAKVMADPNVFLNMMRDVQCRKLDLLQYWKTLHAAGFVAGDIYRRMLLLNGAFGHDAAHRASLESSENRGESQADSVSVSLGKLTVTNGRKTATDEEDTASKSPHSSRFKAIGRQSSSDAGMPSSVTSSDTCSISHEAVVNTELVSCPSNKPGVGESTFDEFSTTAANPLTYIELARVARFVGQFLAELSHFDQAEEVLKTAHKQMNKNYPLSSEELKLLCGMEESMANLFLYKLHKTEAEKWYHKSLQRLREYSTANQIEAEEDDELDDEIFILESKGRLLDHLGHMKTHSRHLEEASVLLSEAEECMNAANSTTGVALVKYHIGYLYMRQKCYVLAETRFREALMIREQWYGKAHPLVAEVLNDLAGLLSNPENREAKYTRYDRAQALSLYRRALKIREQCLGQDHLLVATTLFALGRLMRSHGAKTAKEQALELLKRSLDIRTRKLGADHAITKPVQKCIKVVEVALKTGRYTNGPAKPLDLRTEESPYSHLSYRERDLQKLLQRTEQNRSFRRPGSRTSRPKSAASSLYSQPRSLASLDARMTFPNHNVKRTNSDLDARFPISRSVDVSPTSASSSDNTQTKLRRKKFDTVYNNERPSYSDSETISKATDSAPMRTVRGRFLQRERERKVTGAFKESGIDAHIVNLLANCNGSAHSSRSSHLDSFASDTDSSDEKKKDNIHPKSMSSNFCDPGSNCSSPRSKRKDIFTTQTHSRDDKKKDSPPKSAPLRGRNHYQGSNPRSSISTSKRNDTFYSDTDSSDEKKKDIKIPPRSAPHNARDRYPGSSGSSPVTRRRDTGLRSRSAPVSPTRHRREACVESSSHKERCIIPGPHSVENSSSVHGPHSTIKSLLEPLPPRPRTASSRAVRRSSSSRHDTSAKHTTSHSKHTPKAKSKRSKANEKQHRKKFPVRETTVKFKDEDELHHYT